MILHDGITGGTQEPAELAFDLGAAANRFRWDASQAYLYGSGACFERAVQSLGEMRAMLVGLGPNTVTAIGFVRALINELQTTHRRVYRVQELDGFWYELGGLRREDDPEETIAAACAEFLKPAWRWSEELDSVLGRAVDEQLAPACSLGRRVDQLVRPLHVHRAAGYEQANEVAVDSELDPFDVPACAGAACGRTNASDAIDALLEPELDESYSSEALPEALIGTEVADGGLVPEPGTLGEIRAWWPRVFGRELRLLVDEEVFTTRGNAEARLRAHHLIANFARVSDPEVPRCHVRENTKIAIVEGNEINFGRSQEVFQLFLALTRSPSGVARDTLLEVVGKRKKNSNHESLGKCISRINKFIIGAQVRVCKRGDQYVLRRLPLRV